MSTTIATRPRTAPLDTAPAVLPPPVPARTPAPVPTRFRPDVEGLRGFGFLLLVLTHLGTWPPGGFVGVDLFFPISGFLITGLIVSEIERTGQLSFVEFYKRRARRILPPALVTLAAVWAIARFLLPAHQFESNKRDVLWALGFAANINFSRQGVDYWHSTQPPSFVQHFWSLAVEEQFYVVWPLLVVVVFYLCLARTNLDPIVAVAVCAGVVLAVSLGISIHETMVDPKAAWFSTLGRGWELAAGAVTVLLVRRGWRPHLKVAMAASLLGLTGIVIAASTVTTSDPFPGLRAVPIILATCVVLWSGTGVGGVPYNVVLMNPLIRYIGRISYSLYLWHWVAIRTVESLVPHKTPMTWAAILLANAALGCAGHHFIEVRFQKRSRRPRPPLPMGLTVAWLAGASVAAFVIAAGISVASPVNDRLVASAIGLNAPSSSTDSPQDSGSRRADRSGEPSPSFPTPATDDLRQQIAAATKATTWPVFNPPVKYAADGSEEDGFACPESVSSLPPAGQCTVGDPAAPKVAYLVGDSTSLKYVPALAEVVAKTGGEWRVRWIGKSGCPMVNDPRLRLYEADAKWNRMCRTRRATALKAIKQDRPDMVILTNVFETVSRPNDVYHLVKPTVREWRTATSGFMSSVSPYTRDVVLIAPPPRDTDFNACHTRFARPADCLGHITASRKALEGAARSAAKANHAHYIDSDPWFCVDNDCPAFVGTVQTKLDIVHATVPYSRMIGPVMYESLRRQGLFD